MFGTGGKISKTAIDFNELARIYISQYFVGEETPEDFLARFVEARHRMEQRFDEEQKEYIKQHPVPMPQAVLKNAGNSSLDLIP